MDSKILYEKDGMIFTKIDDKKYNLSFSMENKNILIANIIDFSLFKLIYELNGDIYERVNLTKINENQAVVTLLIRHLFEDLGLPQKYSYFHMTKTVNNQQIIFRSQSIHGERPQGVPLEAELMAMKENIGFEVSSNASSPGIGRPIFPSRLTGAHHQTIQGSDPSGR